MSLQRVDAAQVTAIATEVFAAMVDRQDGLLTPWPGGPATARNQRDMADPMHAWVDLSTEPAGRVHLTTDAGTAGDLTRAMLRMEASAPVADSDVTDALGEIANVFGGNIKALLSEHVEVSLPEVTRQPPASSAGAVPLIQVSLAWRGRPLVITVSTI